MRDGTWLLRLAMFLVRVAGWAGFALLRSAPETSGAWSFDDDFPDFSVFWFLDLLVSGREAPLLLLVPDLGRCSLVSPPSSLNLDEITLGAEGRLV